MREKLGVPVLGRGVLSSWDVGLSDSVYFSPPKQAVALSEPNFWTNSLQIHCIGPAGFGFIHIYNERPPKSRPYSYILCCC